MLGAARSRVWKSAWVCACSWRSTRSIRLTEGGKVYFEQSRAALNQLIEAERKVTGEQVQPSGTIRISAPTTYGHFRLLPPLPAFRAKYPLIRIEAHISNRSIDFHEENFDVRSAYACSKTRPWSPGILRTRPLWWSPAPRT